MFAVALVGLMLALPASAAERRPNLVFILTDNHGPWTLGCYGNREVRTPHIDQLAAEGVLFERSYSSNAVCSPTRATYLTGLMPSQHGVHCFLSGGFPQTGAVTYSTIDEFRSLGEILRDAGYVCGLSGKWHLGDNARPQEGFSAWITKPHGSSAEFYDQQVIENGETRVHAGYLTELWTERGVEFLRANRDRPFFLFLSYNGPYGLGPLLLNESRNRHAAYYADQPLESFPRHEPHPWLFNNRPYINNPVSMRRYAAEVSGIDDGVGTIMQELKALGLDENTLVVFTADQGLAGGHYGFWGMGDHTRPLSGYDWTMHVPLIYRLPGVAAAGKRSRVLVSNYDFLPTVLSLMGLSDQMPRQPESPGRDYSAFVRGEKSEWDDTVYFEFENVRAIRTTDWKLITRYPDGPHELFHLTADPGEQHNLHGNDRHAAVQSQLEARLQKFFDHYADPQYDLTRGGRSKSKLLSNPQAKAIDQP